MVTRHRPAPRRRGVSRKCRGDQRYAAGAAGLRVAPMGTGHNSQPFGDLSGTVLLRTSRMAGIEIDPAARRARVQAGALWLPVVEKAAAHGLAALHGSSLDTSVVGYTTTGGGLGWYGRCHGLAASHVTAVELVLADGTRVRADADHEPDLF
ncbi:FAD-binding protein [Micromonospora zamorensis]|uniref:FAD-binding protein n=1 Tax=Micromonospora zamorensis TaxID=709883 RepID=UPI003CF5977D